MLEAIDLSKEYQGKTALHRLNLQVAAGDIFCLLGQNGAGKTTTIHLFLGFIEPSAGKARVNGVEVGQKRGEAIKHLAYIPENVMLYPHLTGQENLKFFSDLAGFRYSSRELAGFLEQAGLQPEAHRQRVSGYSKGMRQKVGIAIALAKKAGAMLLDEPTSGLDPKASNEFSTLLQDLAKGGVAVLIATHDIFRAKEIGTRVGIMREGVLVQTLNPAALGHTDLEKLYLDYFR